MPPTPTIPVHLVVLIHGMWGDPSHLNELVRRMQMKYPISEGEMKLWVMNAQANSDELTYDGIDWGGERVVDEIDEEMKTIESQGGRITRFSVTGYSLGGLIARYVVGILDGRGFFGDVEPTNFNTIATPHIGMPRYASMLSALATACAKHLSRTGEQLYCRDKWSTTGKPLLELMADPDQMFYKALAKFQHIRIYANAVNDVTVPYVTGAIELEDPFVDRVSSGVQIELDDNYHPMIKKYAPPPNPAKTAVLSTKWLRRFRPSSKRLFLPLQTVKLPVHKQMLLYTLLPVLLGVGVSIALRRFKEDEKNSRARLRDLESGSSPSRRLLHTFGQFEQQAADVVIEVLEGVKGSGSQDVASSELASSAAPTVVDVTSASAIQGKHNAVATGPVIKGSQPSPTNAVVTKSAYQLRRTVDQPRLTARQKKMVGQLNQLPLVKSLAFFDGVRNAHALIICRNAEFFSEMRVGKNVVRHWVDAFVL